MVVNGNYAETTDVACRIELLRQALAARDFPTVAAQARAIQGIAAAMQAVDLVTTCRHLELDAAHEVGENLERLVLEAEAELQALPGAAPKARPLTSAAGHSPD
jgi:HPt (histidine-containing phosphotransfer) domain-containing protein